MNKNINYANLLRLSVVVATIVAIAVITIGVLVTPVVMAITFSYYWLFLYVGYLLAALFIAAYIDTKIGGTRK